MEIEPALGQAFNEPRGGAWKWTIGHQILNDDSGKTTPPVLTVAAFPEIIHHSARQGETVFRGCEVCIHGLAEFQLTVDR